MERGPVSYGTFEAITLQSVSLSANWKLSRDLLKSNHAGTRILVVWIIISASFVLAFPTFLSAMTGYVANIVSFVEVEGGNMVPYSSFKIIRYVVHDAQRIDSALGKDYLVTNGGSGGTSDMVNLNEYSYYDQCISPYFPRLDSDNNTIIDWGPTRNNPECDFYWHVSEYGFKFGFLGLNQTNSTFNYSGKIIDLPAPTLNISAFFWDENWIFDSAEDTLEWWNYPYGWSWKTPQGTYPFHNTTGPFFNVGDVTYNLEQLNAAGRCNQENTSYRWGFSFLILFVFTVLGLIWSIGMYITWVDAYLCSRIDRAGRSMGLQRAILDLAYCMQEDVDASIHEMSSNNELQGKIRTDLKGGRITYAMLDEKLLPISRAAELRLWWYSRRQGATRPTIGQVLHLTKTNPVAIAGLVGSFGFLIAAIAGTHAPLFSPVFLMVGFGTALAMNSDKPRRWLYCFLWVLVAIGFGFIGPYVYQDRHHYALLWFSHNAYSDLSWWYNH
jgi:hypothetical protein